MEGMPFRLLRKGERYHRRSVQLANVLILDLARWERAGTSKNDDRDAILADERAQLARAAGVIRQLTPVLASLDRSHVQTAELLISTFREESNGGFDLPAELVAAAAAANLSIGLSIWIWMDIDENIRTMTRTKTKPTTTREKARETAGKQARDQSEAGD
jgi:hypothetical protein